MMQKNYVNHEGWQLTFSMIDSKHAEIVKGEPVRKLFSLSSRSANTLLIPREIKGHTVTKIGEEAFRLPPDKTPCEVIFPDTVEYIGKKAFASCRNLRSVVLPLSLKEIGDHAFRQCVDLKTVSVSQDVSGKTNVQALKIREGAFFGCSALTSFDLHSIISIDDNGFYKCKASEDDSLKDEFKKAGFSALNFTDSRGIFQFYNLERLMSDIFTAIDKDIRLLNIATQPVSVSEIYSELTNGEVFINEISNNPPVYDYRSIHAEIFGGYGGYFYDKNKVLSEIKEFVSNI